MTPAAWSLSLGLSLLGHKVGTMTANFPGWSGGPGVIACRLSGGAKCLINGVTNIVTRRDRAPATWRAPCCTAFCEAGAVHLSASAEQLGDPPKVTQLVTEPTGAQVPGYPDPEATWYLYSPKLCNSELCAPIFHSRSPSTLHPDPNRHLPLLQQLGLRVLGPVTEKGQW